MAEMLIEEADAETLEQVLALNQKYQFANRSEQVRKKHGYLSVPLSLKTLKEIAAYEPIIVAKVNGKVVAYYISMPDYFRFVNCELNAKMRWTDKVVYDGKPLTHYSFFDAAQVLVTDEYRRTSVGKRLSDHMFARFRGRYDLFLARAVTDNLGSQKFQKALGYTLIDTGDLGNGFKVYITAIDFRPKPKL